MEHYGRLQWELHGMFHMSLKYVLSKKNTTYVDFSCSEKATIDYKICCKTPTDAIAEGDGAIIAYIMSSASLMVA